MKLSEIKKLIREKQEEKDKLYKRAEDSESVSEIELLTEKVRLLNAEISELMAQIENLIEVAAQYRIQAQERHQNDDRHNRGQRNMPDLMPFVCAVYDSRFVQGRIDGSNGSQINNGAETEFLPYVG